MLYGTRRLDISAEESTSTTSCLPRGRRRVYDWNAMSGDASIPVLRGHPLLYRSGADSGRTPGLKCVPVLYRVPVACTMVPLG